MQPFQSKEKQQFSNLIDMVVRLDEVPPEGRKYEFQADEEVLQFLVEHAPITELSRFSGRIELRQMRGGFQAQGRLRAAVVQECVVTLEPIETELDIELVRVYLRGQEPEPEVNTNGEVFVDLESSADNEWFEGEKLDLSDLIFEQFLLALDPYPRKEGAEMPDLGNDAEAKEASPFAVLSKLKQSE
jgi:uncharacterized metal-binding protein YceD (DUF177 family)